MKKFLFITLLLSSVTLFAQSEYNYLEIWYDWSYGNLAYDVPPVKNKTVDIMVTRPQKEKTTHYKTQFNADGRMVKYSKIEDGEELFITLNDYDENGKIIRNRKYRNNGKLKKDIQIERNTKGDHTKLEKYNGKGDLKERKTWEYTINDCLESSSRFNGKGKLKNKWMYEYYEPCEKKRSILLNGKGKVKKQWTYDCKKEGEQLEKQKDITQVCKWEESDGKYLVKVFQTLDEKGRIRKQVNTYRIEDTVLVSAKRYDGKDELQFESIYNPDIKKLISYSFYKNGKQKYNTTYTYEGEQLMSFTSSRKGEKVKETKYTYNENDFLTELKTYKKDGELSRVTKINYN